VDGLKRLIEFLDKLDEAKIYYRLNKIRDSILVEIAVPGQRWEVEFMEDGSIEIEKFLTQSKICDEQELEVLFRDFSD
jgi:hypothetical protein